MARNGVNKSLFISSLSFLKNLYILITIPILFLSNVLHTSDVFNNKSKSCLHGQGELEGRETKTNLDEDEDEDEEDGLIEISLVRDAKEEKLESVKKQWMTKGEYYEEMMIMEIWEEIDAEDNLIEIDISIGSIV